MESLPAINLVSIFHLVFLGLWGGVVATESVLELYPCRRPELHEDSIRYHYWIDILVEAPLIAAVVISGIMLVVLAWPLSTSHIFKIAFAGAAVSANIVCIVLVIQRKARLDRGAGDHELRKISKRIIMCAVVGMPFAAAAAGLGFFLAYHRLLALLFPA